MKIAISGKGGVGKTTLASTLCRYFAQLGWRVVAVDADPDANLATALGFSNAARRALQPLATLKTLAQERTGAKEGFGGLFRLNPKVEDLTQQLAVKEQGIELLLLGRIAVGGAGCACPEHALVRSVVRHLLLQPDEILIMDMEAGIEHLGRGTAQATDVLIVVLEPGQRSVQTAEAIERLAADLGIPRLLYVANKVHSDEEVSYLHESLPGREWLGTIRFDHQIRHSDRQGLPVFGVVDRATRQISQLGEQLLRKIRPQCGRARAK